MGLDSGVAGRYATALYELAKEAGQVDAVSGELATFNAIKNEIPEVGVLVSSPVISSTDKQKALETLLGKIDFSAGTSNFLRLLAKNNRLDFIGDIETVFGQLAAQDRNEAVAVVTSTDPLTEAQQQALQTSLKTKFNKDVHMQLHVDPDLLGGIVIRVGSQMIDNSLRTKLKTLEISMKEVG